MDGIHLTCPESCIKDLDFAQRAIVVRDGKGEQDRVTMLPDTLAMPLQEHLRRVKDLHDEDLAKTMIYTHVLQRGGLAVRSPLDQQADQEKS